MYSIRFGDSHTIYTKTAFWHWFEDFSGQHARNQVFDLIAACFPWNAWQPRNSRKMIKIRFLTWSKTWFGKKKSASHWISQIFSRSKTIVPPKKVGVPVNFSDFFKVKNAILCKSSTLRISFSMARSKTWFWGFWGQINANQWKLMKIKENQWKHMESININEKLQKPWNHMRPRFLVSSFFN